MCTINSIKSVESKGPKRSFLNFISYLQIIGIILVVFGHSFHEYPDDHNGTTLFIYRWCHSFRMPLFLFVSGFLLLFTTEIKHSNYTSIRFIQNKLKRLVLPMIVLTAITFVPRSLMSFAADENIDINLHNFLRSFISSDYMPIPYFWFIHVSFILLCSCFLIINLFKKIGFSALITISIIFVILLIYALSSLPSSVLFSINEIKRIGFFFALGGIYALTFYKLDKFIPWTSTFFFFAVLISCLFTFIKFESSDFIYLSSFLGILMSISIAKIIEKYNWKFLDHLRGANYIIFLLSWYGNVLSQQILAHYINLPWWFYTILSLLSGIYIPWYGYKYLEKHQDSRWIRFTSILLGQSFKYKHSYK